MINKLLVAKADVCIKVLLFIKCAWFPGLNGLVVIPVNFKTTKGVMFALCSFRCGARIDEDISFYLLFKTWVLFQAGIVVYFP